MKSKIKIIIIFGIIIVLMAAAVVILNITGKNPENGETDASDTANPTSMLLYDKKPSDINTLTIDNMSGSYKIERFGEGEQAVWAVKEFLTVPVNRVAIDTLREAAATLTYQKLVAENVTDLSIYGLDNPRAIVKTEFSDSSNTVKEICIGNDTPANGKTYFRFAGEKTVYTVNTSDISCFLDDKYSCINKTVYVAFTPSDTEDTTDYTKINKMVISRKDIDYDIVIEYDKRLDVPDSVVSNASTHLITSPVTLDLNPDKSADVMGKVFGLTADSVEVVNPTDEQLTEYGLNDPFADVFMDIAGGDFHLVIGNENTDKTGRYCYAEGVDVIYVFNNESLPWINFKPLDISTTMITSNYIFKITSLDITGSSTDAHFTMTGTTESDFDVKLNGTNVETDAFKSFYQFLLRTPAEELYFEANTAEPDLTVTINCPDNTDELKFFNLENRRTAIALNGKISFTCKTSYVERLIENLQRFENGETIITSW